MTRKTRKSISVLSIGAAAGVILLGCGGGNNDDTTTFGTGGTVTVASGGTKANTGGASGTGGTKANTGGSNSTGGTKASTGGAPTVTGGAPTTGGAAPTTGGAATAGGTASVGGVASTGGAAAGGGATAVGGSGTTPVAGGSTATGGTAAGGGATSTAGATSTNAACKPFTSTITNPFCTVTSSSIDLAGICQSGCGTGDVTMTGSSAGLAITGSIGSASPVFNANPVPNNVDGGSCAGLSARNPANGQEYTSLTISIVNNMSTEQVVNVIITDLSSGTNPVSYTLTASVTIPPTGTDGGSATVTKTLQWSTFTPSCALPSGNAFDASQILKLGLGVGDSSTTYPIDNVDIVVKSLAFN